MTRWSRYGTRTSTEFAIDIGIAVGEVFLQEVLELEPLVALEGSATFGKIISQHRGKASDHLPRRLPSSEVANDTEKCRIDRLGIRVFAEQIR